MTRKKIQLAWIANENARTISLKKRRLGLVKKVSQLSILCDVKACLIVFSPEEAEPLVWPSVEAVRDLLDDFFALPDIVQKKKEMSLESFLIEKTTKVHEQLMKSRKKNKEYVVDQLMVQLHRGQRFADFNMSEIYELLSFSKDKIMLYRNRLNFMQHPPLPDPPMHLFEAQSEELIITTNDAFMVRDGQADERGRMTDEAARENQNHYFMDRWVFSSFEPPNPQIHQTLGLEMGSYNEDPNPRSYLPNQGSYLPYQRSNSNGNPDLEMEPVGPPVMTFGALLGSVSQPLQHHQDMNNNPTMDTDPPRQSSFNFLSREFGVKEEEINNNNGSSQVHSTSIAMTTNDGLGQEPPPNGAATEEGNVDATSFDVNMVWPEN
ncbi:hypothetical protein AALP_AA3G128000 [Arabis alpina]|uniref:MADS-box domain-containing protein n=1 Tax=Arabis alpina TaxID=50452 RepID=A0A087H8U4_ARAAL|nr:hypothetical protein AALP_AA3G128000 [Arabis alpina]